MEVTFVSSAEEPPKKTPAFYQNGRRGGIQLSDRKQNSLGFQCFPETRKSDGFSTRGSISPSSLQASFWLSSPKLERNKSETAYNWLHIKYAEERNPGLSLGYRKFLPLLGKIRAALLEQHNYFRRE